jgi:hypothetical protein
VIVVEVVLEVSVWQDQDQRRIAPLLINPDRGWKEWAGEYERGTGESFAVQREVARAIAQEVRIADRKFARGESNATARPALILMAVPCIMTAFPR